jgi:hypothetical protein
MNFAKWRTAAFNLRNGLCLAFILIRGNINVTFCKTVSDPADTTEKYACRAPETGDGTMALKHQVHQQLHMP